MCGVVLGVFGGVAALACHETPTEDVAPVCTAPVAISVTTGSTPTFDWSPRCGVALLQVSGTKFGFADWLMVPLQGRTIVPPVRYGDMSAGRTVFGPDSLIAGTEHEVVLFDGTDRRIGSAIFPR